MITEYEKFRIQDERKEKDFFIEVNWKEDEEISHCKMLRVTFPNGETSYVKKEYLNAMLFAIGTPEEQREMIPQKIIRTKWYETIVSIRAKKNIQKGENITFPIKISLPSVEEEAIAEIKKEKGLLLN